MPGDVPTLQDTGDLGQIHQSKWGECLGGEQANSIGTEGMMLPSGEEEEDVLGREQKQQDICHGSSSPGYLLFPGSFGDLQGNFLSPPHGSRIPLPKLGAALFN